MARRKVALILTDDERVRLDSLAHRSRTAPPLARRARIILACAEGLDNRVVARRLRMSEVMVCGRFMVEADTPRLPLSFLRGWAAAHEHFVRGSKLHVAVNRITKHWAIITC